MIKNITLTNFIAEQSETVKNDKTVVDNNYFLETIFGKQLNNVRPLVVTFSGNPHTVPKTKWFAHPWTRELHFISEHNNYSSMALFKPDDSGQYRRKKTYFHALHAVVLDDIGTKVNMDRLTLPPTWLLETSPGNYQAGYLLDEPLTSIKAADQLMNAIINAGLCDPGANGPSTRMARLPIGVNGKHEPPFSCQIRIWCPEQRYSVQELIEGLQLEIVHKERSRQGKLQASKDCEADTVYIPRPEENLIIAILRQHHLYKGPLGDGKHDITCPQ